MSFANNINDTFLIQKQENSISELLEDAVMNTMNNLKPELTIRVLFVNLTLIKYYFASRFINSQS